VEANKYDEMILTVFSNAKGEQLLAEWQKMYGDRKSYEVGASSEYTAFQEGERSFFLHIKQTLEAYK
jgi:ABC-type thiamine transport system substrate-binding protein